MVDYREIKDSEYPQIDALRDYCFRHNYEGDVLKDFHHLVARSTDLGAFINQRLVGQLLVLPLNININGSIYPMGGISFVAVYPENRHSGIMANLLNYSLEKMREDGQFVSVLEPFSISFYRHFGWEPFFDRLDYSIPADKFPNFTGKNVHFDRFDYSNRQFAVVQKIYDRFARARNGLMLRDNNWWLRLRLREPDTFFALCNDQAGVPSGFIRYQIKDVTFAIRDFVAFNYETEKALWGFITSHSSNVFTIKGSSSAHRPFGMTFANPQFEKKVLSEVMIRIVDAEQFLLRYPFATIHRPLLLKLNDGRAGWNNHVYKITDRQQVEIIDEQDYQIANLLETDVGTLSAMLIGYRRPKDYQYYRTIKANEWVIDQWEQAIPNNSPLFYEHF
jgi:predicted acetyltransferase